MSSYRDTTFCASEVTEHTCGREFTEQDAIDAEKWWGSKDYPVAYSEFCKEADNTQPDHIVDMHEMVTDTNQASEDKPINQHLVCLWRLQDIEETIADAAPEELVDLHSKLLALSTNITEAVQALIRTEKLKLLAEVRGRVVGEDLPLPDEVMARTGTLLYNKIKSEEREELTKLEAEL